MSNGHHFGILVRRGGRWFAIEEEDEQHGFIHEFQSIDEVEDFIEDNPLCQSSECIIILDFAARSVHTDIK